MNCEKLHNALALKDQEIKERKENTIRCFEIVKDWALDKLIQDIIEKEFDGYVSLHEIQVYENLFKKIDVDVSKLHFDFTYPSFECGKAPPAFLPFRSSLIGLYSINDRAENIDKWEQYEEFNKFTNKFDHVLFWRLLDAHILRNGFDTRVFKTLRGRKVVDKHTYVTTRSKLEKACCPDSKKGSSQYRVDGEPNMTAQDIFAIAVIVVIFAIAALFIFGGLKL